MCFFNVFLYEWALFVIIKRRSYLLQTILSLILHQIFLTKVFLMLFYVYLIHFYQEKWKKRREMYKMSYLEKKRRRQENNYLPFVMWFLALLEVWQKDRFFNWTLLYNNSRTILLTINLFCLSINGIIRLYM